jgi:hypothetical protein
MGEVTEIKQLLPKCPITPIFARIYTYKYLQKISYLNAS